MDGTTVHAPLRISFDRALRRARESAYAPGEYVEQESFMRASEIRALAERAGIAPGVSVLDLCCGVAGPGRFISRELGCIYLGLDSSPAAIDIARERASGVPCRFEVARIPPLPPGPFDVVLLLETMLAFADKETLLRGISSALAVGGRFAFTLEEGPPLTAAERDRMPNADTVWPTPLDEIDALLGRVGLTVRWQDDSSRGHRDMAERLVDAFAADASAIAALIGRQALDDLVAAHRLWCQWLAEGRIRKLAFVAEKRTCGRLGQEVASPTNLDQIREPPHDRQQRP
jgi:SAM-dependent methyltransferase